MTKAILTRVDAAPRRDLRGGRGSTVELVGASSGSAKLHVFHVTIEPATEPGPYHLHQHAQNVYIVLRGQLEVAVPGGTESVEVGGAITIPAGVPHATHNPGTEPTAMLAIYDRPTSQDFVLVDRVATS